MGDRANVYVHYGSEPGVYLYTHNTGTNLPARLASALDRGASRTTDADYLARVIFCEMVKGHEDGTTGFGISATIGDGADRVLAVDCKDLVVRWQRRGLEWDINDFAAERPKVW